MLKQVSGWWCPQLLSGPGNYLGRCAHADLAIDRLAQRRVAVQAGGHIGTVPVYLADRFERVYTFEPDAENFAALVANGYERHPGTIFAARGILGNKRRCVDLHQSVKSTGQHRVKQGAGIVPTFRVDDLGLEHVDAILLDVEGFEIPALQGAADTIRRCRPVVMCEENKRTVDQGFELGDLGRFLTTLDYHRVGAIADDIVFAHRGDD